MQTLKESVDTTDVQLLDSSSKSENGFTRACEVDIIDEILATSYACNASSSQSPREEQNVTKIIKCFSNQTRLFWNSNIFEWQDKQAEFDLKCVALALPVAQARVERTFSGFKYILNELRLGLKKDLIEPIMFQRYNTRIFCLLHNWTGF